MGLIGSVVIHLGPHQPNRLSSCQDLQKRTPDPSSRPKQPPRARAQKIETAILQVHWEEPVGKRKKWAAEAEEGGTELAHRESTSERTEKMYGSVADTSPPTQTPTLVGSLSPPKTRPLMSTTRYLMWMCWWSHDPFSLLGSMLTASVFDSLNWIFFSLLNRCTVFLYLWLRRLFSLVNLLNWVFLHYYVSSLLMC